MKITDYTIGMESQHELKQSIRVAETRSRGVLAAPGNPGTPAADAFGVSVAISAGAQQAFREERASGVSAQDNPLEKYISSQTYLKKMLLEKLLAAITGKKIRIRLYPDVEAGAGDGAMSKLQEGTAFSATIQIKAGNLIPVEMISRQVTVSEDEYLSFSAAGRVKTADGREMEFSAGLEMRREFFADTFTQSIARVTDPLALNFDNQGARLSQEKYPFDLNGDGVRENISFVSPGSGFLALDLNQDGWINDGRELFGPVSGDGLGELAFYDRDRNGWIDENDPVFNQLQVWEKDAAGRDHLFLLKDREVGAIYLGSVKAEFNLEKEGQSNGQVRRAGLFLTESGVAGSLQQIDLVV